MKLRNKKTGEVKDVTFDTYNVNGKGKRLCISVKVNIDGDILDECIAGYDSLAELNDEWEDYKPIEPLIKDEKVRKLIKNIFPEYALIHIEKQGGKRIFEFGGTRLEIEAPNENAIKHGFLYTIAELCGEE